jgi:hypothetical protein
MRTLDPQMGIVNQLIDNNRGCIKILLYIPKLRSEDLNGWDMLREWTQNTVLRSKDIKEDLDEDGLMMYKIT